MTLNPVLVQDLRSRMRSGSAYLLLTAVILSFGGATLGTYWAITNVVRPANPAAVALAGQQAQPPTIDRLLVAERGVIFFVVMALWAVVLTALIVPAATSGTVARERETSSLPLLMSTPVSTITVILGKLAGSLSYVLLIVAAGIPLFSIVLMFGGVSPGIAIAVAAILVATAFAFASLGILVSALSRNGLLASFICYTLVLLATVGSYGAYLAASPVTKAAAMKYALYASPLAAVLSASTQDNGQLTSIVSQLFREPGTRVAGEWWAISHYPLWYVTTAVYLVLGILFTIAAARAINPLRRWI